jgi:2-polyprenyl-3-methyl-5-hydroxy-6-metoxy-1,4-benzoquinol methylase
LIPERLVPGTQDWEQYHYEHEQRYQFFAGRYTGMDVLDAACGIGYGSAIIASAGAKSVTGIDVAPEAISYAQKHYARSNVGFIQTSAEKLRELDKTFDLVVSFETIEHLKDPAAFLREVRGVLRPGGRFICSTPNRDFGGKPTNHVNPHHLSEMSLDEFVAAFQEHFRLDEKYHQSHSDSYRRHMELVSEFGRYAKAIRFSKFLAVENRLRKWFGKDQWLPPTPTAELSRAGPGDYVIEALEHSLDKHLTFILVGHAEL